MHVSAFWKPKSMMLMSERMRKEYSNKIDRGNFQQWLRRTNYKQLLLLLENNTHSSVTTIHHYFYEILLPQSDSLPILSVCFLPVRNNSFLKKLLQTFCFRNKSHVLLLKLKILKKCNQIIAKCWRHPKHIYGIFNIWNQDLKTLHVFA